MSTNIVKFSNLEIEIDEGSDEVTYTFKGDVDENFRQKDLPRVKKEKITLVLDAIDNFNSCGIREWIYFIKDIGADNELIFKGCSVTMVDQINMVPDSLGNGIIESFYAPYFCNDHGEINKKVNVSDYLNLLQEKQAPEFKCPNCENTLEFDALEESYFLFADTSGFKSAS